MVNRYPKDRVNSFCDAIFSIALTLLILEVKVPSKEDLEIYGTWGALARLTPSFIALFISFFVTAAYWRSHLIFAQYIKEYDSRLFWLTLLLLLSVVFMPFSTAFYAKNFQNDGPFTFYCLNMVTIGFLNWLIIRHIIKLEDHSSELTPLMSSKLLFRASVAPIVWSLSVALVTAFPHSIISRAAFLLIFVILVVGERMYRRKFDKTELDKIKEIEAAHKAQDALE